MYLFSLLKSIRSIWLFNSVNSSFHREARAFVDTVFSDFDSLEDLGFPENGKVKIQWYIAEFMYVCKSYNELHGTKASAVEKQSYLWAGILGTLCDLIIDDIPISDDRLVRYKNPESGVQLENDLEKLYVLAYKQLKEILVSDQRKRVFKFYNASFDAQVESKKQFLTDISIEEIDRIAKLKCGNAMLFMRALTSAKINQQEESAIMELGAFVQFANDTQDMHKDYKSGIRSFATARNDIEEIRQELDMQHKKVVESFNGLHLAPKRRRQFLLSLQLMKTAILYKTRVFEQLCNGKFSHETLALKSKKEIRYKVRWNKLLVHVLSSAVKSGVY